MNLFAQLSAVNSYLLIGLGAAGAGTGFGGLIWWIIGRSIKKAIAHPDDQTVHLRSGVTYVTAEEYQIVCEQQEQIEKVRMDVIKGKLTAHTESSQNRNESIQSTLKEHSDSITKIHDRIDTAISQQHEDTTKILTAINKIK